MSAPPAFRWEAFGGEARSVVVTVADGDPATVEGARLRVQDAGDEELAKVEATEGFRLELDELVIPPARRALYRVVVEVDRAGSTAPTIIADGWLRAKGAP